MKNVSNQEMICTPILAHGFCRFKIVATESKERSLGVAWVLKLTKQYLNRIQPPKEVSMIYKVEGDILLSKAQAIVQGIGLNDPMDKGLALELHNQYPAMHKDFHRWCHQHNTKPGEAWMWGGPNNDRIVNLITQEGVDSHDHRHGKATLSNVRHALSALVKIIAKEKLTSIALPRLATGIGDLEWDDVWPLIERSLGDVAIPVYVYAVYHPGLAAVEPGV